MTTNQVITLVISGLGLLVSIVALVVSQRHVSKLKIQIINHDDNDGLFVIIRPVASPRYTRYCERCSFVNPLYFRIDTK